MSSLILFSNENILESNTKSFISVVSSKETEICSLLTCLKLTPNFCASLIIFFVSAPVIMQTVSKKLLDTNLYFFKTVSANILAKLFVRSAICFSPLGP